MKMTERLTIVLLAKLVTVDEEIRELEGWLEDAVGDPAYEATDEVYWVRQDLAELRRREFDYQTKLSRLQPVTT